MLVNVLLLVVVLINFNKLFNFFIGGFVKFYK